MSLVLLACVGFTGSLPAPASWLSSKAPVFFIELVMCLCIAIAVKGCQYPRRVFFYLFNASLLACALFSIYAFFQNKNPLTATITTVNENYLAVTTLIAACALFWANRLWTQERLLPYLKRD